MQYIFAIPDSNQRRCVMKSRKVQSAVREARKEIKELDREILAKEIYAQVWAVNGNRKMALACAESIQQLSVRRNMLNEAVKHLTKRKGTK